MSVFFFFRNIYREKVKIMTKKNGISPFYIVKINCRNALKLHMTNCLYSIKTTNQTFKALKSSVPFILCDLM